MSPSNKVLKNEGTQTKASSREKEIRNNNNLFTQSKPTAPIKDLSATSFTSTAPNQTQVIVLSTNSKTSTHKTTNRGSLKEAKPDKKLIKKSQLPSRVKPINLKEPEDSRKGLKPQDSSKKYMQPSY